MPSVQVNNLGQRDVPVSISFLVPIALKGEAVWTVKAPQLQVLKTSRGSSAKALDFYPLCHSQVPGAAAKALSSACLLEPSHPVLSEQTGANTI